MNVKRLLDELPYDISSNCVLASVIDGSATISIDNRYSDDLAALDRFANNDADSQKWSEHVCNWIEDRVGMSEYFTIVPDTIELHRGSKFTIITFKIKELF